MTSPAPLPDLPDVEGVSHRWVEARGVRFHLAEAGAGAETVLCLHGWPQHWFMWRSLMPILAERHRVLALDLRGLGWSEAPPSGYEKENMATDVIAVLDELGIDRVRLVGHDWGGWVGFLLALREPRRVERFLALGIAPPWPSLRSSLPHAWRFLYQAPLSTPLLGEALQTRAGLVQRTLVGASTVREQWDERVLDVFAATYRRPESARAAVRLYRAFLLREMPALLRGRYEGARLTVPTLLVNGADDFAVRPALLAGYERHADEMSIEIVDGCGHFVVDEVPDLVADRARSFLSA